jgi:hypothetical protein
LPTPHFMRVNPSARHRSLPITAEAIKAAMKA